MRPQPAKYKDGESIYHADTCDPVKAAVKRRDIELVALGKGTYPGRQILEAFLPGILALGYWNIKFNQSWKLDWHRNEGIEFTLLDQGHIYFGVDDEEFNLKPVQLTVTRPWQKHTIGKPYVTASRLHYMIIDVGVRQPHTEWTWPDWVVLSEKELKDLTEMLRGNENPVWKSTTGINECFLKIKREMDEFSMDASETKLKLLINEFLLAVQSLFKASSQPLDPSFSSSRRTVRIFLDDLPNHLEIEWTLEDMARHCRMGRTLFSTLCSELTNQTPMKYLLKCRIEKAEKFLKDSDLSITDIALECGFKTCQYLSTQFKKVRGCTPRQFRITSL
jgi:AraC family L-rhamnose operon regulatory protein RhaS